MFTVAGRGFLLAPEHGPRVALQARIRQERTE